MDDTIVLIAIAIIITITSLVRKLKAKLQKQHEDVPPGGGLTVKLITLINAIASQIERQSGDRSAGVSKKDQILAGNETFSSTSDAAEEYTQPLLKRRQPVPPVRDHTLESDGTQSVLDSPQRQTWQAGKSSRRFMAASHAELRRAIIWSEILGPPVALRDQNRGKGGVS